MTDVCVVTVMCVVIVVSVVPLTVVSLPTDIFFEPFTLLKFLRKSGPFVAVYLSRNVVVKYSYAHMNPAHLKPILSTLKRL